MIVIIDNDMQFFAKALTPFAEDDLQTLDEIVAEFNRCAVYHSLIKTDTHIHLTVFGQKMTLKEENMSSVLIWLELFWKFDFKYVYCLPQADMHFHIDNVKCNDIEGFLLEG